MVTIHLFGPLLFAFIFLRAIRPLRCGTAVKVLISLIAAFGCFKLEISRLFGGPRIFSPDFPAWLLIVMTWAFSTAFLIFPVFLLGDIGKGICYAVAWLAGRTPPKETCRTISNRVNLVLLLFVLLITTAGMISGLSDPVVKRLDIAVKGLPPEAEGTRLALMADIHTDSITGKDRVAAMVERANSLAPDAVLIAGDIADGSVFELGEQLSPLTNLVTRFGAFGAPGNHDYYSGLTAWLNHLENYGVRMLVNSHVVLPNGIIIAGVADPAAARLQYPAPDVAEALRGAPDGAPSVLIAHTPRVVRDASRHGVSLQLSGHTHGGTGPLLDSIVASANAGFVRGLYKECDTHLYVSPGTGIWNGFPIRIFNPPEITLITLRGE